MVFRLRRSKRSSNLEYRTRLRAGQLIFRQGETANRFFPTWLFPPHTWHFSARAIVPTGAISFYGTQLREAYDSNHDLGYELMKQFSSFTHGLNLFERGMKSNRLTVETAGKQNKSVSFE